MKVIKKRLDDLKHPEKNVRIHSEQQIRELKRSLEKFGQTRALVVDENNVILIGNGLYEAMVSLGYQEASVYVKSGSFLIGVIVAFVYGYGGMFAAGNMTLANIYPITASLGMIHYRSYDAAVSWNLVTCTVSLAIVVAISAGLILCMKEKEPKQVKKKAKKVAPKKGW